ncbi:MAG: energy transducer TonB [Pseudomonadota bacterium]
MILSLLLHGGLILIGLLSLPVTHLKVGYQRKQKPVEVALIANIAQLQSSQVKTNKFHQKKMPHKKLKLAKGKQLVIKQSKLHRKKQLAAKHRSKHFAKTLTSGQQAKLLMQLHNAITRQQKYPQAAINLQQQGNVTVAFTLQPNGKINNLRVIKSSGYGLLDAAALASVRAIVPFKLAQQYLRTADNFQITLRYDL